MKAALALALVSVVLLGFADSAAAQSGGFFFPGYGNTYGLYSYGPGYNYGVNGSAIYGPSYNSLYNLRFSRPATVSYYPPVAAAAVNECATIQVIVPSADAEVALGKSKTTSTGRQRVFVTNPLEPGNYGYAVTATWTQNGQPRTEIRDVLVAPGRTSVVDFTAP